MTSLQYNNPQNDLAALQLRRSDRKKTKKIIKDDFLLPNPFKNKTKRHRSLRLPQNLDSQIKKIQFLTQRTLAMLNYGKQEFSLQMLKEMKQAVNQQQIKLSEFVSIKLIGEKMVQQSRTSSFSIRYQKQIQNKQNTPKGSQSTIAHSYFNDNDYQKQVLGISTAQQLYCSLSDSSQHNEPISAFGQDNVFEMGQIPRFRKESSKLLSDNYENNELFYTIDHLTLNWHKDEQIEEYMQ